MHVSAARTRKGRRAVRCRYNNHRSFQAFGAKLVIDKLEHFAISLANESNHRHIRGIMFRQTAQQNAFANAATAKNSHALAFTNRQHAINGTHARHQTLGDVTAIHGIGRGRLQWIMNGGFDGWLAVDRPPVAVQNASE